MRNASQGKSNVSEKPDSQREPQEVEASHAGLEILHPAISTWKEKPNLNSKTMEGLGMQGSLQTKNGTHWLSLQ